jgi:tellurite resistance protein TerC
VFQPDPVTDRLVQYATPLFLALCLVAFADLIFAVDSVPAIFAITADPFIVYTSNIFAISCLRALYFALALVLVFIGAKIFLAGIMGKMPAVISLTVTVGLIAGDMIVSLWKTRRKAWRPSSSRRRDHLERDEITVSD